MLRVVLVTAPRRVALSLARRVVSERLAACANIIPGLRSLYWWKGRLERSSEALLIFKTPARNLRRLFARIRRLHPYEVPEILALSVRAAHRPYAEWVARESRPPRPRR
jgi:periplasmic divalent cation tolerance protein